MCVKKIYVLMLRVLRPLNYCEFVKKSSLIYDEKRELQ